MKDIQILVPHHLLTPLLCCIYMLTNTLWLYVHTPIYEFSMQIFYLGFVTSHWPGMLTEDGILFRAMHHDTTIDVAGGIGVDVLLTGKCYCKTCNYKYIHM